MKKRLLTSLIISMTTCLAMAQGWPSQYSGVMLQAFSWDSYDDTNWSVLTSQADELSQTFDLVWLPQSAYCGGQSMGYDDMYWFTNYNSSFGTEKELRTLINTFKQKGIKTIADVVINHRRSNNGWFGFPTETYKGVTYTMGPADVCSDDDGGKAAAEAKKQGVSLGAKDTGEGWDGMRDLDHTSKNVQNTVKAYLDLLLNDLGYAGFRYDMVKGYSPQYTAIYNTSANPEFSVGECWDGTNTIKNWMLGTRVDNQIQSAVFDFQFKYVVRNAVDLKDWTYLNKQNDGNWPLISTSTDYSAYRRWAVTFVENHDTQVRPDGTSNGPLKRDTLAANAYLMAMPGTPCIFQPHWLAYPTELKAMVSARKAAGIHNESTYTNFRSHKDYFANIIKTNNENRLLVVVGNADMLSENISTAQWTKVLSGYHYAYYFPTTMNTAYVDLASSIYEGEQRALLTAVTAQSGAQLVYTTNGQEPTASSTRVASGTTVTIPLGTTTLKVGLLIGGQVSGVVTRTYVVKEPKISEVVIPDFCKVSVGEVCAFFEAPATWAQTVKCWAWNDSPAENFTSASGTWPGADCTLLGTAPDGNKVWKWTWDGTRQHNTTVAQPAKIIFSNSGSPQTDDLPFKNGGYYTKDGLFDVVPASIGGILATPTRTTIYSIDGRRMGKDPSVLSPGWYIINCKKVVLH